MKIENILKKLSIKNEVIHQKEMDEFKKEIFKFNSVKGKENYTNFNDIYYNDEKYMHERNIDLDDIQFEKEINDETNRNNKKTDYFKMKKFEIIDLKKFNSDGAKNKIKSKKYKI